MREKIEIPSMKSYNPTNPTNPTKQETIFLQIRNVQYYEK